MKFRSFRHWSLQAKVTVPVVLLGTALIAGMYFVVSMTQRQLLLSQAEKTARYVATQIDADRKFYTQNVVSKLAGDGLNVTAVSLDQLGKEKGSIPLPATFVHATSNIVNSKGLHTVDLLSLWNINDEKAPRNDREKEALERVAEDKTAAVSWIADEGTPSARYFRVTADIASSPACVTCHNTHPLSPKKNFKLNDPMGGLVVSLPLADELAIAQRNTWLWSGMIGGALLLLILTILYIQLNHVTRPIKMLEAVAERLSRGDVDTAVAVTSGDEIGRLGIAFERLRQSVKISLERLMKK